MHNEAVLNWICYDFLQHTVIENHGIVKFVIEIKYLLYDFSFELSFHCISPHRHKVKAKLYYPTLLWWRLFDWVEFNVQYSR